MKTEPGLYGVLERILKDAKEPLTCVKLYQENEEVREFAATPNRVSDYLGGLWRKGLVYRLPAPRTELDASRWAYEWRRDKKEPVPVAFSEAASIYTRPGIDISQQGDCIVIDLPKLTITIQTKR